MPPSVELSPETFGRLQAHAVPLVDTIESVINRLIDLHEKAVKPGDTTPGGADIKAVRIFNPGAPPDLTHTKVLGVVLDNKELGRSHDNWNGLLNAAVRLAKTRAKSLAELKTLVKVNIVEGLKTDEGYRHMADLGISLQGQDANGAWRAACHITQQLQCQLSVTFAWREKEGAAHPGVTGRFVVNGK